MAAPKGKAMNPNGRPKGKPNGATVEFRQAVTNLLTYAAPEMIGWLKQVAETSPDKALDHVSKLAEYANPKLARTELANADDKPFRITNETDHKILDDFKKSLT
jgi:hypothetical protein